MPSITEVLKRREIEKRNQSLIQEQERLRQEAANHHFSHNIEERENRERTQERQIIESIIQESGIRTAFQELYTSLSVEKQRKLIEIESPREDELYRPLRTTKILRLVWGNKFDVNEQGLVIGVKSGVFKNYLAWDYRELTAYIGALYNEVEQSSDGYLSFWRPEKEGQWSVNFKDTDAVYERMAQMYESATHMQGDNRPSGPPPSPSSFGDWGS